MPPWLCSWVPFSSPPLPSPISSRALLLPASALVTHLSTFRRFPLRPSRTFTLLFCFLPLVCLHSSPVSCATLFSTPPPLLRSMVALQVPRASAWVLLLAACGGARGVASAEDGGSSPGTVAFKTAVSTGVHVGSGLGSSATVVAARSGQQTGETAKAPSITQAVLASNPSLSVTSSTASSDVADTSESRFHFA